LVRKKDQKRVHEKVKKTVKLPVPTKSRATDLTKALGMHPYLAGISCLSNRALESMKRKILDRQSADFVRMPLTQKAPKNREY
jgi:hypothetical protein